MIKEVYKLRTDSWHYKMMKFIWNFNYYDFPSMCPYTWLTILNVFIIIPVAIFKFLIKPPFVWLIAGIKAFYEKYEERCLEKERIWIEKMRTQVLSEIESGDLKLSMKLGKYFYTHKDTGNYRWSKLHRSVQAYIGDYKKYGEIYDKLRNAYKSSIIPKKSKKVVISEIAEKIKVVLIIGGMILGLVLLYLLYLLIGFIAANWSSFINGVVVGLIVLSIAATIVVIGVVASIVAKFLSCKFSNCFSCTIRDNKFLKSLAYPFVSVWKGIVFLYEIIIELKNNHCPSIEWEKDESD